MINDELFGILSDKLSRKTSELNADTNKEIVKKNRLSLKYSEVYSQLVLEVIQYATSLNKWEEIAVKRNILDDYGTLNYSKCFVTKDGMNIKLVFDNSIETKILYNEKLLNDILSYFGIYVKVVKNIINIVFVRNNYHLIEEDIPEDLQVVTNPLELIENRLPLSKTVEDDYKKIKYKERKKMLKEQKKRKK